MTIIDQIVSKFQQDYTSVFAPALPSALTAALALALTLTLPPALALARTFALAQHKQNAFWERYYADEAFRKQIDSSYTYRRGVGYFDFWLNSLELKEFLREDLQSAELILIESNKASALSLKQVERALSEARDAEEFKKLVLEERASKADIWFELERKLDETRI